MVHTEAIIRMLTSSFDAKADSLGVNKAKKLLELVGDHAPAHLIVYLATGESRQIPKIRSTRSANTL